MLDYVIPVGMIIVFVIVFYGIIVVHDIPYEIAVHRNHPHQDAIHVAGWISLLFMGAIWPFLWIWATLYREDRGWGMIGGDGRLGDNASLEDRLSILEERLKRLEMAADLPVAASDAPEAADREAR